MFQKFLLFPLLTAFLVCGASARSEVLKTVDIAPESCEDVLTAYLKRADTVLLVCVYEAQFSPRAVGKGVLWDKDYQCRIVQTLRGKVPMGGLLVLHKKAESLPDTGVVRTEGDNRFISALMPGTLWYVFLDSRKLKNLGNNSCEYSLDTMWLNPLSWSDQEGIAAFEKLVRVEEGRITEESEAARFQPESGE